MTKSTISVAAAAALLAALLSGCGNDEADGNDAAGSADLASVVAEVNRGAGIDPATHAGTFQVKVTGEREIAGKTVPLAVYAGLTAESETRLGMNVFADLRSLQAQLPDILSGVLDDTCKRTFTLEFAGAEARGNDVRAWGTVLAQFSTCNRRGPEGERPGVVLLSQRVDAVALATAEVKGQCVEFILIDLELDPTGLLGGLSNVFGVTRLARAAIFEKGGEYLKENPICPDLPKELQALEPRYTSGGSREVGDGGIGAGLSASIDTSAETVIGLLSVMKERGILEGQQ